MPVKQSGDDVSVNKNIEFWLCAHQIVLLSGVCEWGSRENSLSTQCILFTANLPVSKLNITRDDAEGRA